MGRCALLLVLALLPGVIRAADSQPRLERDASDRLVVFDLPNVLADEVVFDHLISGLTTTLLLRAAARLERRARLRGEARIAIRHDLWDETFEVVLMSASSEPERHTFESREALESWFVSLRVPVLAVPEAGAPSGEVKISIDVLPFSRSEELDTERWFSDSLKRSEEGRDSGISRSAEGEESLGRVVDVLIATSIRRLPVTSYTWQVPWPERGEP